MAQKLTEDGLFAATVESCLSPEVKYPVAVTDKSSVPPYLSGRNEFTGILKPYGTGFKVHTTENMPTLSGCFNAGSIKPNR